MRLAWLPVLTLCGCLGARAMAADSALARVLEESQRLRQMPPSDDEVWKPDAFHSALRDWVESRLPDRAHPLPDLQNELAAQDLVSTGRDSKPGLVSFVDLVRPEEDLDQLIVRVGVTYGCGSLDRAYVYDYRSGTRKLVFQSQSTREHDEQLLAVRISKRDPRAGQLVLTVRYAMQCGSSWNQLAYDLYRIPQSKPIFSGEHGIWFGGPEPQFTLTPDDLRIDMTDHSIDNGVHSRPHVLHYRVSATSVTRIDPVAVEPRDFVDEWLTRKWVEMESRTLPAARAKLRKIHEAADWTRGSDFEPVQQCATKPGLWDVGIQHDVLQYYLVEQTGPQQFRMLDIDSQPHPGCP